MGWRIGCIALLLLCILLRANLTRATELPTGPEILEQLRAFQDLGSVLHVAAHPDDENTQLITYLARGRRVRAAYLSITRGDGGQNLLGPEFDEELGLIRTHELLAARRLDGGRQFFTRAIDFGYSKDPQETLRTWDGQAVLGDVVRVIRTFQPDVIITRFNPQATRTHGHHTASAILALEAFKVAGDPTAFPEQLTELKPWQPKRILLNGGGARGGDGGSSSVQMDVGGNDVLLGESFSAIASRSRAMHKSQGFGSFGGRGGGGGGPRSESFSLLGGEPAAKDIFDGIDITWNRVLGGGEISKATAEIIANFKADKPAASLPALLALKRKLAALPDDLIVNEKRRDLDRVVQACLGLSVQSGVTRAEASPGDFVAVDHSLRVTSEVPVRWVAIRYPTLNQESRQGRELPSGQYVNSTQQIVLPEKLPISQPYWLREPRGVGVYRVADGKLIGQPVDTSALLVEHQFEVDGQMLTVAITPEAGNPQLGSLRPFEVTSPVWLSFDFDVACFAPGVARPVRVSVNSKRPATSGELSLSAPSGWKVVPSSQKFEIATPGEPVEFSFTVTPPAQSGTATIAAQATVDGRTYDNGRVEIHYDHIPHLLLQPAARLKAVSLDLKTRGKRIGYIPGAGDSVAECIAQMGYEVKQLKAADLNAAGLRGLDAVVVGVRAFNIRDDLAEKMPALFEFAEAGGNLIVQYNRPEGLRSNRFAPYELRLSGERVTDEESPVNFLLPDHPALNAPNKISKADFNGWVQERGIYFPNQWDDHFTPILEFKDPAEPPLKGGILIAPHGKGHVVYTSLVWFRELPAGVPGAYRLFANLLSLGKE